MARTERWHPSRVLVAHVASSLDLHRAQVQGWYRLRPCPRVDALERKLKRFRYLALYEAFDEAPRPFRVQHFARIEAVEHRLRSELIPHEPDHLRANVYYPVLRLGQLKRLRRPVVSCKNRPERLLETDWDRLMAANEWNDLYSGSPLEQTLYTALRDLGLSPEREFRTRCRDLDQRRMFLLDFALFCREGRLDIEVDGDTYHLRPDRILRDRDRDKVLVSNRWNILRFHSDDIRYGLRDSLRRIADAANAYGGIAP